MLAEHAPCCRQCRNGRFGPIAVLSQRVGLMPRSLPFGHRPPHWSDKRSLVPMYGGRARVGAGRHCSIGRKDPAAHRARTGSITAAPARGGSGLSCVGRPNGRTTSGSALRAKGRYSLLSPLCSDCRRPLGSTISASTLVEGIEKNAALVQATPVVQLSTATLGAGAAVIEPVRALWAAGSFRPMEQ
jgi:hypothetical protein